MITRLRTDDAGAAAAVWALDPGAAATDAEAAGAAGCADAEAVPGMDCPEAEAHDRFAATADSSAAAVTAVLPELSLRPRRFRSPRSSAALWQRSSRSFSSVF